MFNSARSLNVNPSPNPGTPGSAGSPQSGSNSPNTGGFWNALGSIFNLGASGVQAGANKRSQEREHDFSASQAQLERDFNAEQAAAQRLWASNEAKIGREWSASAWQRTVSDMKKAGLNPLMMYMKGGAPVSGGGGASGGAAASSGAGARANSLRHDFSSLVRGITNAISNSIELQKLKKDVKLSDSLIKKQEKETQILEEKRKQEQVKTDLTKYGAKAEKSIYDFQLEKNQIDRYMYRAKQYLQAYESGDKSSIPGSLLSYFEKGAKLSIVAGALKDMDDAIDKGVKQRSGETKEQYEKRTGKDYKGGASGSW